MSNTRIQVLQVLKVLKFSNVTIITSKKSLTT
jgi:hypothetical protein